MPLDESQVILRYGLFGAKALRFIYDVNLILSAQLYIEIVIIHSQWLATFLLICQTIVKRHTLWTMACITDIDA